MTIVEGFNADLQEGWKSKLLGGLAAVNVALLSLAAMFPSEKSDPVAQAYSELTPSQREYDVAYSNIISLTDDCHNSMTRFVSVGDMLKAGEADLDDLRFVADDVSRECREAHDAVSALSGRAVFADQNNQQLWDRVVSAMAHSTMLAAKGASALSQFQTERSSALFQQGIEQQKAANAALEQLRDQVLSESR